MYLKSKTQVGSAVLLCFVLFCFVLLLSQFSLYLHCKVAFLSTFVLINEYDIKTMYADDWPICLSQISYSSVYSTVRNRTSSLLKKWSGKCVESSITPSRIVRLGLNVIWAHCGSAEVVELNVYAGALRAS